MSREKILKFDAGVINKRTGLYQGVYKSDIKSFIRVKIANDKKLGRLDQVVKLKRDIAKIDRWAARNDYYGKKRLLNYFKELPNKLNTPIVKQQSLKERKNNVKDAKPNSLFYMEMQRIRSNPLTKDIQKATLDNLKQTKSIKDYLKDNVTLAKKLKTTPRKKDYSKWTIPHPTSGGDDYGGGLINENYQKFNNIISDMGGLQNAIDLYSNTIDRKAEIYSVDLKLYAALFD